MFPAQATRWMHLIGGDRAVSAAGETLGTVAGRRASVVAPAEARLKTLEGAAVYITRIMGGSESCAERGAAPVAPFEDVKAAERGIRTRTTG